MSDWTAEQLEAAADKADAIRDEIAGLQAMVDEIGTLDWPGMVTTADVKLLNLSRELRRNADSIRKRAA